jgi:hypothetical protein
VSGPATVDTAALYRYTDQLDGRLVGSRARRTEILDEVLDGLHCAAEDNLSRCRDGGEAARRAVREWGAPGEVARAYNEVTVRLSAHRLSLHALYVLPLLAASWAAALLASPDAPWAHHPRPLVFGVAVGVLGGLVCLAGASAVLRRAPGVRAAARVGIGGVATGALAAITGLMLVLCALAVLLLNRGVRDPDSLNWHLVPFPGVLTVLVAVYFAASLKRFLLAVRVAGTA